MTNRNRASPTELANMHTTSYFVLALGLAGWLLFVGQLKGTIIYISNNPVGTGNLVICICTVINLALASALAVRGYTLPAGIMESSERVNMHTKQLRAWAIIGMAVITVCAVVANVVMAA